MKNQEIAWNLVPNKRLQINAAATVFFKNREGKLEMGPAGLMVPKEDEHELRQFALEFKKFPVPANQMEAALDELKKAILDDLQQKGLLKY